MADDTLTPEEKLFKVRSEKFILAMKEFKDVSEDERSWALIDSRQFEIMDANVDNTQKATAFDYVLNEISRIHPRTNLAYCIALERRLDYTPAKDDIALRRISQSAYEHRGDSSSELFRKIIATAFQNAAAKRGFPNANIAKSYLKKQAKEYMEDDLCLIRDQINDPFYDPVQKLNKVQEALEMLKEEKYLGPIQSNLSKQSFCEDAVRICQEELHDGKTAEKYSAKAFDFKRRAANALRWWKKRRNLWTDADEKAYLKEFGTISNIKGNPKPYPKYTGR